MLVLSFIVCVVLDGDLIFVLIMTGILVWLMMILRKVFDVKFWLLLIGELRGIIVV